MQAGTVAMATVEFMFGERPDTPQLRPQTGDARARSLRGVVHAISFVLALLAPAGVNAERLTPEQVPAPLAPWVDWVLKGNEEFACPFAFDNYGDRRCAWPGELQLVVTSSGGAFSQAFDVHARSWVALPGDGRAWPHSVAVDGDAVPVVPRGGAPGVLLQPGPHTLTGGFSWERLPESLQLPASTGLLALTINRRSETYPDLDAQGRLWLARRAAPAETTAVRNTLDLQVFRRIVDTVPVRVETQLALDVAGEPRELTLGPVLLEGFAPLELASALPALLEPDGTLKVQARAGRHVVSVRSRSLGPVHSLTPPTTAQSWPGREIWVFDARNYLRVVSLEGVASVDPRQTSLPEQWRSLPAFQLETEDVLELKERRRGDPDAEPDSLTLARTLWLDFDGGGYTVRDRIGGALSRSARLELNPPLALGRVDSAGGAQFITQLGSTGRRGVELRPGPLALVADSRFQGAPSELPAVGWEYDFTSVGATLNLPPGWRLVAAHGADRASETWLGRFSSSLFDLFVVLVIAAAAGRLYGWLFGLVALLGLVLSYHEPEAPRWVWLNVLAAAALLGVLPKGKLFAVVRFYRAASLIALAVVVIPFAAEQLREAAFPQLEHSGWSLGDARARTYAQSEPPVPAAPAAMELSEQDGAAADAPRRAAGVLAKKAPAAQGSRYSGGREIDPNAKIQTGPGLPQWQWRQVRLSWSGPVARDELLHLWLVSPRAMAGLKVAAVVLIGLLFWRMLVRAPRLRSPSHGAGSGAAALALAVSLAGGMLLPAEPANAQMPSEAMLDELRGRLLEPPDCSPACADNPRVRMQVSRDRLRVTLEVHALEAVSVPLPGRLGQWQHDTLKIDDGAHVSAARDADGWLWVQLEPGIHTVLAEGPLPARRTVQIGFRVEPRRVAVESKGWTVDGVSGGRLRGAQIQLTREGADDPAQTSTRFQSGVLPPFVAVERTLQLGLEWRASTTVRRLSPAGAAAVLRVPLLEGESVLSDGVQVSDGGVLVSLAPGQRDFSWSSGLEQRESLALTAPEDVEWTEIWKLDASPVWHVEHTGLPAIFTPGANANLTQWYPWPGERLQLEVVRPEGVAGPTLTIQRSRVILRPGARATEGELELDYLSSQGGEHTLTLPDGARLQNVTVDGREQPIRQNGRALTLPVTPGAHRVGLTWRSPGAVSTRFRTPAFSLGIDSANAAIEVRLPPDRWTLWTGGPLVGPAVLFWGLLVVIVVLSAGLARTRRTPLGFIAWLLLGVGLSQIFVWLGIVVVGWLLAIGARGQAHADGAIQSWPKWRFNFTQLGLALLTVAALTILFFALKQGLLGHPEMQIAGNGSHSGKLRWFVDRAPADLPGAFIISVPLIAYRVAMLLWASWLAIALIRWLRWAWSCYAAGGYWRAIVLRRAKPGTAANSAARENPASGSA